MLRIIPELIPRVTPLPSVMAKELVPRFSALIFTEELTVVAAVTDTFVPGVLKSVA